MAERRRLIITIDGPSGAGKSTIARALAKKLQYTFIDTGAMYRGVAYAYKTCAKGVAIDEFLKNVSLRFQFEGDAQVFLDGADISKEIRSPEISLLASALSQQKAVREYLYKVQREIGGRGGAVLEGRDTGSVVFPDAPLKFYLDADPDERAKRRHLELTTKGEQAALEEVREEMVQRDKNDSERDIAPLVVPSGAVRVDTTGIGIDEVLDTLLRYAAERELL